MKMIKFKKSITKTFLIVLIFSMLLSLTNVSMLAVNAAASPDVGLAGYSTNKSQINAGDEFNLGLNVKTYVTGITDIYVVIDESSAFTPKYSGSIIPVNKDTGDSEIKATDILPYTYNGSSNKIQVTIKYKLNGTSSELTDYLTITQAVPKDNTPSTPVDTSKYVPKISISSNAAIPTGSVGIDMVYTLPLKNTSPHYASRIVVSPVFDDTTPILMETMNISQTIDSLQTNETKEVKFNFKISTEAKVKTYPIKFNIQYYNAANDYFTTTETAYLKVEAGIRQPKLQLKSVATNPSPVAAGEKFKLDLTLENKGTSAAKDVVVTLLGLKSDGASMVGTSNRQTKANIYGGFADTVSFDMMASPKMESGTNSLKAKVEYTDSSGTSFSDEIEFFYNVQDASQLSSIELKNIVSPKETLAPGSDAVISLDVVNTGTADAKNVKVSLGTDKELLPKTLNTIIIPVLRKGETKNVQFQLEVSDEAVTRSYPVSINVEYGDNNAKQTVMQYVGLFVESKGSGKSVPRLIIDRYTVEPQPVKAGETFVFDFSILNTSSASGINNVKVTLSSDDGTFMAVNSNTFYIDKISPKSSASKAIQFSSKSDAAPKQYMISINYEYEDEKGNPYSSKDMVGISLQQSPRLVLGELSFPPEAYIGNPVPVNLSFFNMGKSTLYNLMVKLEGNFRVEGTSYFVGNFEPGKTDSFDGMFYPEAVGPINGSVVFTYEDAAGNPQEVRKEIVMNAMEMPMPIDPGGPMMPVEEKNKIPLWGWISGGVVLAAGIAAVVITVRKKLKARKERILDEEF